MIEDLTNFPEIGSFHSFQTERNIAHVEQFPDLTVATISNFNSDFFLSKIMTLLKIINQNYDIIILQTPRVGFISNDKINFLAQKHKICLRYSYAT